MKASRLCLVIIAAIVIGLFTASPTAHADTFQIFDLTSAAQTGIVGITASGTVVLVYNVPVGAPLCATSGICHEYETWVNGVMVKESTTAPDFAYDNGTPCTADAPFLTFSVQGTCNNGHEVYSAGPSEPSPYTLENFTGPDPVADLFPGGPLIGDVNLNASGDFVYNAFHPAGGAGELLEAIDLTTGQVPEPASIFLLGTGLLAALGTMRRRLTP